MPHENNTKGGATANKKHASLAKKGTPGGHLFRRLLKQAKVSNKRDQCRQIRDVSDDKDGSWRKTIAFVERLANDTDEPVVLEDMNDSDEMCLFYKGYI